MIDTRCLAVPPEEAELHSTPAPTSLGEVSERAPDVRRSGIVAGDYRARHHRQRLRITSKVATSISEAESAPCVDEKGSKRTYSGKAGNPTLECA